MPGHSRASPCASQVKSSQVVKYLKDASARDGFSKPHHTRAARPLAGRACSRLHQSSIVVVKIISRQAQLCGARVSLRHTTTPPHHTTPHHTAPHHSKQYFPSQLSDPDTERKPLLIILATTTACSGSSARHFPSRPARRVLCQSRRSSETSYPGAARPETDRPPFCRFSAILSSKSKSSTLALALNLNAHLFRNR